MADGKNVPKIDEIVNQTNILDIINQVLSLNDGANELVRFLKVSLF